MKQKSVRITAMNVAQLVFFCVLLHFRYSIMTDLMILEVVTVFIAAFVLGIISFLSMSHILDYRMEETLETMGIISRERLSRSLIGIRSAVKSMRDLAIHRLDSYGRFANDAVYRESYLHEMEELFQSRNEFGVLMDDIREMVSMLEIYVYRDKLTGLRNTAAYMRYVEELKIRQKKGVVSYAVIVFDANFLKRINDRYGHKFGNRLIQTTSSIIRSVFSHSPVYRIGGDEFVAILEGQDYEHREELLAEFDVQTQKASISSDGLVLPVSVARGLGVFQALQTYEEVFRQAEAAMYKNKAAIKEKIGKVALDKVKELREE